MVPNVLSADQIMNVVAMLILKHHELSLIRLAYLMS